MCSHFNLRVTIIFIIIYLHYKCANGRPYQGSYVSYSYVQPIFFLFFFFYYLFTITEIYSILALSLPKPEETIYERNLSSI